jgi:hypothetical protein
MNQRTAMLTAGGLVLAMVVAGVALAMGITGPSQAAAHVSDGRQVRSPIVRTVSHTETVHRQAHGSSSSVGSITALPAAVATTSSSSGMDDTTEVGQETEPIGQEHEDD